LGGTKRKRPASVSESATLKEPKTHPKGGLGKGCVGRKVVLCEGINRTGIAQQKKGGDC